MAPMDRLAADRVVSRVETIAGRPPAPIELLRRSVAALGRGVPVDAWCGLTLDPVTVLPTGGYHDEGVPPALVPRLMEIEYGEGDAGGFDAVAQDRLGAVTLAAATGGDLDGSARYRDVLLPSGLAHELRVALRAGRACWGALVIMRGQDAPGFTPAEVAVMGRVGTIVGEALRRSLVLGAIAGGGETGPSVMILRMDDGARVESASPPVAAWREALDDGDDGALGGVPFAVLGLAATALARDAATARCRSRGRNGTWMTMHAAVLDRAEGRVAIVRERSRPHEILSLTMDAHGVSPREREVVELALRGHANAAIAERLVISPLTVQDHLKSAFRKLGVAGRAELTARLVVDHYLPRMAAGASPGPDGTLTSPAGPGRPGPAGTRS